jgi:hypothetical protein
LVEKSEEKKAQVCDLGSLPVGFFEVAFPTVVRFGSELSSLAHMEGSLCEFLLHTFPRSCSARVFFSLHSVLILKLTASRSVVNSRQVS